jgi:hypothetical protein
MRELAVRTTLVADLPFVPGRGEVNQAARELVIGARGQLGRAQEGAVGRVVLPLAQVPDAEGERSLEAVLLRAVYVGSSQEKPTGRRGGESGLRGSPRRGSTSLYSRGATSFGPSA